MLLKHLGGGGGGDPSHANAAPHASIWQPEQKRALIRGHIAHTTHRLRLHLDNCFTVQSSRVGLSQCRLTFTVTLSEGPDRRAAAPRRSDGRAGSLVSGRNIVRPFQKLVCASDARMSNVCTGSQMGALFHCPTRGCLSPPCQSSVGLRKRRRQARNSPKTKVNTTSPQRDADIRPMQLLLSMGSHSWPPIRDQKQILHETRF